MRTERETNSKSKSEYHIGVFLIVISAITFSSAGLFTKGVEAGAWDVTFWRALSGAACTTIWLISRGSLRQNLFGMGYSGLTIAIIGAIGSVAFIQSFKLTSIANVSLIYAISPLIAAVLSWFVIGEKVSLRMLIGCVGALLGVTVIVAGSLGEISLYGDLLALCMTIVMASIMVIYRKYPDTPGAGPAILSSVLLLPFTAIFGSPTDVVSTEIYVLIAFGFLFAIASVTLAEGAKRVPSGQTALLSSLETPLAPAFAFILFMEIPSTATFIGGFLVFFAVLFSIKYR